MATTAAEHLALINAVITQRLGGDAYEEYREAFDRFKGTSLADLYEIRAELTAEAAAAGESGASFRLYEPMAE